MSERKTMIFEELTVGEILYLFGDNIFCSAKSEYISYGKDLEGAFKHLSTNANHLTALRNAIGLKDGYPSSELVNAVMPFMALKKDEVINRFTGAFTDSSYRKPKNITFKEISDAIFTKLSIRAHEINITLVHAKLIKEDKPTKSSKHNK